MKTYFAYIRVSTTKQGKEGSSLSAQRDAIEAFARRNDLAISEWYEEQQTAAKIGRAAFLRMMGRLERGGAAGIILHKIDRGARNLWDWARIQSLLDIGIEVHFAHDNLDMKSRGGRLAADIQAVVAADYVRNLREETRKGLRGRLKQGLLPRAAPLGYQNNGKGKAKTIDPIVGPLVRLAFELYASRQHSFKTLRKELHREGLTTKNGSPLNLCSITAMLRNPFYAGVIRLKSTGEHFPGIHEPLISADLFQEVQNVLDGKLTISVSKHEFLYRRLLKCGLCGTTLIGERQKGHVYYRCHTTSCPTTGIREDHVSTELSYHVEGMLLAREDVEELIPIISEEDKAWSAQRSERLRSADLKIAALKEREARLTDAYVDQLIDRETYERRKALLFLEIARAREARSYLPDAKDTMSARIDAFFGFVQSLDVTKVSGRVRTFRDAVNILTSNRTLVGKKLCVTLQSPFQELSSGLAVLRCSPARGDSRNSEAQNTDGDTNAHREVGRTLATERAEVLLKHLRGWKPPPDFTLSETTSNSRTGPQQWRKNLMHQRPEDELREAA
ncbi:MAG: recombinase family protein [Reyranella sp.]|uniref:recombinase family protein n=1 Tax=Reyranella sp. TaxID=1929291 RepID=UPI001226EA35|nr:recombinase family protein [Reyranella sp.]TAJ36857.1 MAG: recombinase family protein [Reyranella sp.]